MPGIEHIYLFLYFQKLVICVVKVQNVQVLKNNFKKVKYIILFIFILIKNLIN
jgi:hypothetical protein